METVNDISLVFFTLSLVVAIAWGGMSSGVKWKNKLAFEAILRNPASRPLSRLWAIFQFRPDILLAAFVIATVLLKTAYELYR